MTPNQKLLGVAVLGVIAGIVITKMSKKNEKKSNFDDVFNQDRTDKRTGVLQYGADGGVLDDFYDFDADYDFDGPNDFYDAEGSDDFYDAKGGGQKKRQLKKWQRRVKVLSKKIQMANKGLIKAQNKVAKWQTKLTEAQQKVADLSK